VNAITESTSPHEQWQRLAHGYRDELRSVGRESQDELRVPLSAVFSEPNRRAVIVDDDGRAELGFVEIGREDGRYAQILDGLEEGERIVLHPNDRIADGTRIEAREGGQLTASERGRGQSSKASRRR